MSETIFRDNEQWLSRTRVSPSRFYGWNHSANAAPKHSIRLDILANTSSDHSIRLETRATPLPKHSIRLKTRATPLFKHPIQLDMPIPSPPKHPPPIGMLAMDKKRVQCRWHRFPPCKRIQGRLLPLPTLAYRKYNPDGVEENHMRHPYHITNGMRQSIRPNIPSVWIYWQSTQQTIPSD